MPDSIVLAFIMAMPPEQRRRSPGALATRTQNEPALAASDKAAALTLAGAD